MPQVAVSSEHYGILNDKVGGYFLLTCTSHWPFSHRFASVGSPTTAFLFTLLRPDWSHAAFALSAQLHE